MLVESRPGTRAIDLQLEYVDLQLNYKRPSISLDFQLDYVIFDWAEQ